MRASIILLFLVASQPIYSLEQIKSPKEAFDKLKEGNERFMSDKSICPDRTTDRRLSLAAKQKPFAVILGCSDSRIPPEIIFDQGLGDLFVVRVAGNVVGATEMDSIKYSVYHNGSCLVVVLGHERCGAVDAVLNHQADDVPAVGKLVETAIKGIKGNSLEEAVKKNVRYQVDLLRKSDAYAGLIKEGKLDIIGAYYHFTDGNVEILKAE